MAKIKSRIENQARQFSPATVIAALDAMALALAGHDHQWSAEERRLYERAIAEAGRG